MTTSSTNAERWSGFRDGLIAYTRSLLRDGVAAPLQVKAEPTLMSLCFAVCLLDLLDAMDELDGPEVARRIAGCQGNDGVFRDPLVDENRIRGFDQDYVDWQMSAFCLSALDSLGVDPDRPPVYLDHFLDGQVLSRWLENLPWNKAWYISNKVMFVLNGLQWRRERDPRASTLAAGAIQAGFETLDSLQDPRTGYWGTQQGSNLFIGMGGAFHILIPYYVDERQVNHAEQVVSSTLKLQTREGLFRITGGGACDDLDAVDMLVKLGHGPRVERSLRRCMTRLMETQLPDGGFPWYERRPGLGAALEEVATMATIGLRADFGTAYRWLRTWGQRRFLYPQGRVFRYSGIHEMPYHPQQSDLWSSWFRAATILLCADHLGVNLPIPVRFKTFPGLTFHRPRHPEPKP